MAKIRYIFKIRKSPFLILLKSLVWIVRALQWQLDYHVAFHRKWTPFGFLGTRTPRRFRLRLVERNFAVSGPPDQLLPLPSSASRLSSAVLAPRRIWGHLPLLAVDAFQLGDHEALPTGRAWPQTCQHLSTGTFRRAKIKRRIMSRKMCSKSWIEVFLYLLLVFHSRHVMANR